jgi:hypothetical protein
MEALRGLHCFAHSGQLHPEAVLQHVADCDEVNLTFPVDLVERSGPVDIVVPGHVVASDAEFGGERGPHAVERAFMQKSSVKGMQLSRVQAVRREKRLRLQYEQKLEELLGEGPPSPLEQLLVEHLGGDLD